SQPHIWYYAAKTGAVREISVNIPPPVNATPKDDTPTQVEVPDLNSLKLDASSISPDGYEFRMTGYNASSTLLSGLIIGRNYYDEPVLSKNGRSIRLPNVNPAYYSYSTHFVG